MATKQTRKPRTPKVYPDEQKIVAQLDTLTKQIGEKEPSQAQKDLKKSLRAQLGSLKFVRLAKARVAKAKTSIRAIGKLSGAGYVRTAEQVANISKILNAEVATVEAALTATKAAKEVEEVVI